MVRRSNEPLFWAMFSAGGMLAALVLPALVVVLWLAPQLGWIDPPSPTELSRRLAPAPVRLGLFVLVWLSLFHWAHRFRFTLYDGLQLSHLYGLIAVLSYGVATLLTLIAAWGLWNFP